MGYVKAFGNYEYSGMPRPAMFTFTGHWTPSELLERRDSVHLVAAIKATSGFVAQKNQPSLKPTTNATVKIKIKGDVNIYSIQ